MSWTKNFILLVISISISYILLIVGDWYLNKNMVQQLKNNSDYGKAQNIEKQRIESEDLPQKELAEKNGYFPYIVPSNMDMIKTDYPLIAGLPNTKTYYCNEGYGLIKYHSDRFGFRNKDESWNEKNPILLIGDSFVHGACVHDNDTLTANLEKNTKKTVLSVGMSANHPGHYMVYSELFIPKVYPSYVYLVFYANDNVWVEQSALEKAYLKENKKIFNETEIQLFNTNFFIKKGHNTIDLIKKKNLGLKKNINENFFIKAKSVIFRHSSLPKIRNLIWPGTANFKKTKEAIYSTSRLCNNFKCNLEIVFIPNSDFYRPDSRADKYGDSIKRLANIMDIKFIDGRDVIDRSKNSEDYAIKGPHLSPIGYKKLANYIYAKSSQ